MIKRFLPALIWMGLIFLGSTLPGASVSGSGVVDFLAHKTVHIFEFSVLGVLLVRGVGGFKGGKEKTWVTVVFVLLICFFFGLSDEYHQSLVPGREARLCDALVDLLGSGVGILVLWKLPQRLQKVLLR